MGGMTGARMGSAPDAGASIEGKRVLVTGANTGIGKWTAIGLAELGASVVLHARSAEKGSTAQDEVKRRSGRSDVDLLLADFSSLLDVRRLAMEVLERYPRLDVLVNNAAINAAAALTETSLELWQRIMTVNAAGTFLGCKWALPAMERSGGGSIINMSSFLKKVT